jgi:hypothetical protein
LAHPFYDAERRPSTADVVLANRQGGPERGIAIVEERAPDGFVDLGAVISPEELEEISQSYKRTAGFEAEALNNRPSLSVARHGADGRRTGGGGVMVARRPPVPRPERGAEADTDGSTEGGIETMLTKERSNAATRNLASGARHTVGAAWGDATRQARALVWAVQRELARSGAVRILREFGNGTLRDIGVSRDGIPSLVCHWLDESDLGGGATTEAPPPRWISGHRRDGRAGLTAALLGDPGAFPPTDGEREANRDGSERAGMVHPSRIEA